MPAAPRGGRTAQNGCYRQLRVLACRHSSATLLQDGRWQDERALTLCPVSSPRGHIVSNRPDRGIRHSSFRAIVEAYASGEPAAAASRRRPEAIGKRYGGRAESPWGKSHRALSVL